MKWNWTPNQKTTQQILQAITQHYQKTGKPAHYDQILAKLPPKTRHSHPTEYLTRSIRQLAILGYLQRPKPGHFQLTKTPRRRKK